MVSMESTKSLIARVRTDPWSAVIGRRPQNYQIPEVGNTFIELIDQSLFERDLDHTREYVTIYERWAKYNPDFKPKALAAVGSFFMVNGKMTLAETKMTEGLREAGEKTDCLAECNRRLSTLYLAQCKYREAMDMCNTSMRYYRTDDDTMGVAVCFLTRGAVWIKMHDFENGLQDEERGIELLNHTMPGFYLIIGGVNVAWSLTYMGKSRQARSKIEEIQETIQGQPNMERPRISLRWLRALLLEQEGCRKNAGEILDRVEQHMIKLDMDNERRALLADYARIARSHGKIRRLAERAKKIEKSPGVLEKIDRVLKCPSDEHIRDWRSSLDTYMPVFSNVA